MPDQFYVLSTLSRPDRSGQNLDATYPCKSTRGSVLNVSVFSETAFRFPGLTSGGPIAHHLHKLVMLVRMQISVSIGY